MNLRVLKAQVPQIEMAYALFFFGCATYAYIGKWPLQIGYWMVCWILLSNVFVLFGPGSEIDFAGGLAAFIGMVLSLIWPVHLFLSIPNLIKKRKLELYEIMAKSGQQ